jgi:hypothetical protein
LLATRAAVGHISGKKGFTNQGVDQTRLPNANPAKYRDSQGVLLQSLQLSI